MPGLFERSSREPSCIAFSTQVLLHLLRCNSVYRFIFRVVWQRTLLFFCFFGASCPGRVVWHIRHVAGAKGDKNQNYNHRDNNKNNNNRGNAKRGWSMCRDKQDATRSRSSSSRSTSGSSGSSRAFQQR